MPGAVLPNPMHGSTLPEWLQQLLMQASISPVSTAIGEAGAPMLGSLGKRVDDMLGATFTPTEAGTGVPKRIEFTNVGRDGLMQFHGSNQQMPSLNASPAQVDELINGGALDLTQPPQGAVDAVRKKLSALLGPASPR